MKRTLFWLLILLILLSLLCLLIVNLRIPIRDALLYKPANPEIPSVAVTFVPASDSGSQAENSGSGENGQVPETLPLFVGTYELLSAEAEPGGASHDPIISQEQLARARELGIPVSLDLQPGGFGELVLFDQSWPLHWNEDGNTVLLGEEESVFSYDAGILSFHADGTVFTFGQTARYIYVY